MTALRGTAFVVGAALLGATAHATIGATGGYGTAHSFVTLSIAAGVAVSALVIGAAWRDRRCLATWLVVAIVAGEAFGFLSTAERLIAGREAAQTPLRAAADAHAKASQRVAAAAAAMVALPTTSPRLEAAIAKKDTADRAATEKSAERGCRENCRQLLQGQIDEAAREVAAARAALADAGLASKRELDASRAALAALKAPESATPLADRVGIAAWALDLLSAALGSMAANGLACGLISFAGHRRRSDAADTQPLARATCIDPVDPAPDCVQRFAFDRLFPADGDAGADVLAIKAEFRRWCAQRGIAPPNGAALGQAMADLFEHVGIALQQYDGRLMAMGVTLKTDQGALPAISGRLGKTHRKETA